MCPPLQIQKIGKGHTSVVWRCEDAVTRQELALKEIVVDRDRQRTSMAVRELLTTYGVDHVVRHLRF
jgi:serine/threonine protein kinase